VTIALLLEFGGRYHELNKTLAGEVRDVGRQLLDVLGRADRLAVFKYGDKLETLVDFDQRHEIVDGVFERISAPGFSETNFYDALLETLNRVRDTTGERKAVIVVATGLDTFSKASYEQVLQAVQDGGVPVYAIGLVRLVHREAATLGDAAPFARIDWNAAEKRLENMAKVSGGRAYVLESEVTLAAIYDDIMENLRLRYVITYVSSHPAASETPRKIRVELIDPETGQALKIRDSNGKVISAKVFVQESYSPSGTSGS
jgi:VWFA-related protein